MTHASIYLDYNATAPVKQEVVDAVQEVFVRPHNPSSVHGFGREGKRLLDEARAKVAALAGAQDAQIIFTSSGTEANNLAIKGAQVDHVFVSAIEHSSVLKPAQFKNAELIPVDENGIVRLEALEQMLSRTEGKVLVSVMLANNETGAVQPIAEITKLVLKVGGIMHTDAAQACGKIPVDMAVLNVDMLTVSAHKFGGPQGAAALIIKKGLPLDAQILGGGQESGLRAGTENVPTIVGMGVAADLAKLEEYRKVSVLRDKLEVEIKSIASESVVFAEGTERLPNTSMIALPGMSSETQLIAFDLEDIAISAGSACSSGKVETSHVLLAMGIEKALASCAIRVSLGPDTTEADIDRFIAVWKQLYERAQAA